MQTERTKAIFLGIIGIILVVLFFWIMSHSKIVSLLRHDLVKDEILHAAELAFQESSLSETSLPREVELQLDEDLLNFAQRYSIKPDADTFLPFATWEISWQGEIELKKEGMQEAFFSVTYDLNGRLVRLSEVSPYLNRPPNFKEEEALRYARQFLSEQNVDTVGITLINESLKKDDRVLNYTFSFTKPSEVSSELEQIFDINIKGRAITEYRVRVDVVDESEVFSPLNQNAQVAAYIAMIGTWFIIIVFLVILFIKKLRRDELEFKRGLWMAAFAFGLSWAYFAFNAWPDLQEVLIAGGIVSTFSGVGMLLLYSTTESLNREIWPEKLALIDVLNKGLFRVRELGKTLLDALFFAGAGLALFAGALWLAGKLNWGYITFDHDLLWIFEGRNSATAASLRNLLATAFVGLTLFAFWATYLRSKTRNNIFLLVLVAVFLNLAGLQLYYIRPAYLAFLFYLPLALVWGYFIIHRNLPTVLLAFFIVNLFSELALITLAPEGFLSAPSLLAWSALVLIFGFGVYARFSKTSVEEFDYYVPEYVGRIAERERFLKELEIARNVQMRFLPQAGPNFPQLDIASVCRPALEVGGDYYDFISNGNDSLGVVIGDVSGKGVSAAFYMTMAKGILKTLLKSTIEPKKVLSAMNSIFFENVPRDIFISVIFGVFDMENRVFRFARAGHNPLLVRKQKADQLAVMHPKGIAIGLEKGFVFDQTIEEESIALEPGDTFVFFTDGISESMNKSGDEFGEEKLRKIVAASDGCKAQVLLDKISDEVRRFTGDANQHDDFTMVVVRVNG